MKLKKMGIHLLLIYLLLIAMIGWSLYQQLGIKEEWICSNAVCSKVQTPEEWIKQNCFLVEGKQQCKVNLQGTDQLIPIEKIDTSKINICLEANCIQEARVRSANYTLNITAQKEFSKK